MIFTYEKFIKDQQAFCDKIFSFLDLESFKIKEKYENKTPMEKIIEERHLNYFKNLYSKDVELTREILGDDLSEWKNFKK
jgi:hypothetical protein